MATLSRRYSAKPAATSAASWLNVFMLGGKLARLDRYCAAPRAGPVPDWDWIGSDQLPADTLLVVARDDDFTAGVLRSSGFAAWWAQFGPGPASPLVVDSFPFPWPPATALSSLTSRQQELRFAVARAARQADQDQLDRTVAAAYGWPATLEATAALPHLLALHRLRAR